MAKHYKDLCDLETGEIYSVPKEFSMETHEIKNKKQLEYQKKYMEQFYNQFTWGLMENIKELLSQNKITLTGLGAVLILLPYLDNDGFLKRRTVEGKPYLTRQEIFSILKLGSRNFEKIMKELKECGLLISEGSIKNQIFKLNTNYHLRGTLPEGIETVVRIQNKGLKALYKEGNTKLDQIGFFYLLLPYLSYDCCILVKKPNFKGDNDNALSLTELGETLGMTNKTVQKYLSTKFIYSFKDGGLYEVPVAITASTFDKTNKKVIILNPVLFRRNEKITGELKLSDMSELFRNLSKKL
mgnify:FL=1